MNINNRLDKLENETGRDDVFIRVLYRDGDLYSDSFDEGAEWLPKEEALKNYPKDKLIRVPGIGESNI
jgi:hypothetical protein